MAKSKGSQDGAAERQPASGSAARRTGWARWRPYSAAVLGVAVLFAISAVIGAHVRSGESTDVKWPTGLPSTGPQALSVPVKPAVPATVTVYEDLRSPVSKAFAAKWQPVFHKLLESGDAEMAYRMVLTTDVKDGGQGSMDAANAAGCAQDQGTDYFQKFVKELWKHQPAVSDDRFASATYLEKLGHKVKGLEASLFVPCVQSLDHQGWVNASQAAYVKAGLGEVPVVQIDGVTVQNLDTLTPDQLISMVRKATERMIAAEESASPSAFPSPETSTAPSAPVAAPPSAPASVAGSPSA